MKKIIMLLILSISSTFVMADTIRNVKGKWVKYECPATGSCHLACVAEVKAETPPGDAKDCRTTFSGMIEKCDILGVGACDDTLVEDSIDEERTLMP